jgi:hypothetical protein
MYVHIEGKFRHIHGTILKHLRFTKDIRYALTNLQVSNIYSINLFKCKMMIDWLIGSTLELTR